MDSTANDTSYWVDEDFNEAMHSREWLHVPERRLLFAILERAVRDAAGNAPEEAKAAKDWLLEPFIQEPDPFSFQWICEQLEVDKLRFIAKVKRTLRARPQTNGGLAPHEHSQNVNAEKSNVLTLSAHRKSLMRRIA